MRKQLEKLTIPTYCIIGLLCCLRSSLNKCCNTFNLASCPSNPVYFALSNTLFRCWHFLDLYFVIDIFQVVYLNLNIRGLWRVIDVEGDWMLEMIRQQWLGIIWCICCIGLKKHIALPSVCSYKLKYYIIIYFNCLVFIALMFILRSFSDYLLTCWSRLIIVY